MITGSENSEIAKESGHKTQLSQDRLIALFHVSQRINRINDLQQLLEEILHSAIPGIGAQRGLIILTDESGDKYQTVASESLKKEELAFSTSIVQATLERKQTLLSSDIRFDSRFKSANSVKALRILSFICVPLIIPGRDTALGTLYVDQRLSVKSFTPEDAAFLGALANLAAIAISNAHMIEQLVKENIQLRHEVGKKYSFPGVIAQSKAMQKVLKDTNRILNDDSTVLLTGESGTGKEVIAKAIHYNGIRKDKPFLAINCGALPDTLLEAELFGSVRGAFTGALDKQGLFQAAHGGTLFLDEIHHTSEAMQIKLLRVLQEREIRRVGGTKPVKVNVRLVCATNEDLQIAVEEKRFRRDFYYRINVITIRVPPLRERRDDVVSLAHHFLEKYSREKHKPLRGFDQRAIDALQRYNWEENNVRELENEIERVVIYAKEGSAIRISDLSDKVTKGVPSSERDGSIILSNKGKPLTYDEFERKYIENILSQVAGNQTEAARIMGIPRTTLRGKMKKLGMTK